MTDLDDLMEFAVRTAGTAGALTLEHFGRAAVRHKEDGSDLTDADTAAEQHIREAIADHFPADGVLGEEGAELPSRSGRRWIVDPIDGTRSFGTGVPLYAVLLALEVDGAPVLGCAHFPAMGRTLVGARGAGAWIDGAPARVSPCDELGRARVVTSGLEYWRDDADDAGRAGLDRLVRGTRWTRTWGDAFGYLLVATGQAEIFVDPVVGQYWDFAPFSVIVSEAGGRFTRLDGASPRVGSAALASNHLLHAAASGILLSS
jgi:histidinol phosphatase-like enzyme (inositol monophosphatase family)